MNPQIPSRRRASLCLCGLAVFFCPPPINASDSDCIEGNGAKARIERPAPVATKIEVGGAFELRVTCGRAGEIILSGDSNILPHVHIETIGETLRIKAARSICPKLPVTIEVGVESLVSVQADGAGETRIGGLHTSFIAARADDAATLALAGETATLEAVAAGSAMLNARELKAQRVRASSDGAATLAVVAQESLAAVCRDAATLLYSGPFNNSQLEANDACDLQQE